MSSIALTLPVEREVLFTLCKNEDVFIKDAKKMLALNYFKAQQLSLGLASKLADMNKDDFIQYLGENQVDIYQYSGQEFDEEVMFLSQIGEKSHESGH